MNGLLKKTQKIPPMAHVIFFTVFILLALAFLLLNQNIANLGIDGFQSSKNAIDKKEIRYNVFGDHFVNDLSIDKQKTTFYYDRTTTAFTFEPAYNWRLLNFSGNSALMLDDSAISDSFVDNPPREELFKISGQNLTFQDKQISMPNDLKTVELVNVSSYNLGSEWLVGFVFNLDKKEMGRAYRFDGRRFTAIDSKNSFLFESRAGFPGAKFGFGGDENNFIVLYSGYDLLGYQVRAGKLISLSQFFNLRMADGGFMPKIIKQEIEGETNWYICSLSEGEPRFIKLWQNKSDSVKGSLSFTEKFFGEKGRVSSALCFAGEKSSEIKLKIKSQTEETKGIFTDNGFKQDKNYVLMTGNLFKEKGVVLRATFGGLIACDDKRCGGGVLNNLLDFSVSGDGEKFKKIMLEKEFIFPDSSSGLYWQIAAKTKDGAVYYSPWIDGLTSISYSWK